MFCQQCGNPIRETNRFCTYCGADATEWSESLASVPTDSGSNESANVSSERSRFARILSWFRHLPFAYQVIFLGLASFVLVILLSPITYRVGQAVILLGVVVVAVKIYSRAPWRSWGLVLLAAIPLTLIGGLASNIVYDTAFLGGIGYELTAEEIIYIDAVSNYQNRVLEVESDYRALDPRSPDISEDEALQASSARLLVKFYYIKAEELDVPSGCEEHYEIWLERMENILSSVIGEDQGFMETSRANAEENLEEADILLDKIRSRGCGG